MTPSREERPPRGERWWTELMVVALYASAALTVVYVAWGTWRTTDETTSDSLQYLQMAQDGLGTDTGKPFRFRVLVPWLASGIPAPGATYEHAAVVQFALLNVIGLTVAALALRGCARHFGFDPAVCLLGGALPFLCYPVIRYGGVPMVDSMAWGVLALGFLMALRRQWLWFAVIMLVGMVVKETTVVASVLGVLAAASRRDRLLVAVCSTPGIAAYAVIRWVVLPTQNGFSYDLPTAAGRFTALLRPSWFFQVGAQTGTAFGVLWLVAAWGVWRNRSAVRLPNRLVWAVPGIVAVSVVIHSSYARVCFLAFPVVMLFALNGLPAATTKQDRGRLELAP